MTEPNRCDFCGMDKAHAQAAISRSHCAPPFEFRRHEWTGNHPSHRRTPPVHDIKVQPQFWPDVRDGNITAQLRRNDRAYGVGDTLLLREHNPSFGYTGARVRRVVTHVLRNEDMPNGCPPGWVVLSMRDEAPLIVTEDDGSRWLALGNAELDAGTPNLFDQDKRGFTPQ